MMTLALQCIRFPAFPSADFTLSFKPSYPPWFHFGYKSIQNALKPKKHRLIWTKFGLHNYRKIYIMEFTRFVLNVWHVSLIYSLASTESSSQCPGARRDNIRLNSTLSIFLFSFFRVAKEPVSKHRKLKQDK